MVISPLLLLHKKETKERKKEVEKNSWPILLPNVMCGMGWPVGPTDHWLLIVSKDLAVCHAMYLKGDGTYCCNILLVLLSVPIVI